MRWPVLLFELMVSVLSSSYFTIILQLLNSAQCSSSDCSEETSHLPPSYTGLDWQLYVLVVLADICIITSIVTAT